MKELIQLNFKTRAGMENLFSRFYYRPRLSDGRPAPMPWQVRMLRFNIISWPHADTAPQWLSRVEICYWICSFFLYGLMHWSNYLYIAKAMPNLSRGLLCFSTYLVMCETQIRIYHMAYYKQKFKQYMKHFYGDIFVEESVFPAIAKKIRFKYTPTNYYAFCYVLTYLIYFVAMVVGWFHGERKLMYRQEYPYDYTPLGIYLTHTGINFWVGIIAIWQIFGETSTMAMCILHTNGRYEILIQDMCKWAENLLKHNVDPEIIANEFQNGMRVFIKRNKQLNSFVAEMEDIFTFRVFFMVIFSAIGLCTIFFNVSIAGLSKSELQFFTWIVAKILELFVLGEAGSTLTETTNKLSSVYFHTNWQDIISRSNNTVENLQLMKLILMAMQLNSRPLSLTGLNFFRISLSLVLGIIQAAFSYFTFLRSVN